MRVVFMGTPEFAVPALETLAREYDVVAVYTRPDAVSGRGGKTRPSPVKAAAHALGIEVRQPKTLRDVEVQRELSELSPDVVVVAAYGLILPREVLDIPVYGCINIHGSLLPRWRGAAPVQRAILAGDEVTGVSIMRMEEGLDTGPYCEVETVPVGERNTDQLTEELAHAGARALMRAMRAIAEGSCEWIVQDETKVTYAEKISKDEAWLDPSLDTLQALRRIRASSDQAPARLKVGDRMARVLSAEVGSTVVGPGSVACENHAMALGFADGALNITIVKPEGKGAMAACDWARGARFDDTTTWGSAR